MIAAAYDEPTRPLYHFTAERGWLNDPNGLVFARGEYHLFFQHNPFGTDSDNKTWGHAVSPDLLHWQQLPEAIAPDDLGTIYSGSAVVDSSGSAGFGKGALVCIYTAAGGTNEASKGKPFTQCLAYSLDGKDFTKFSGNPVLPNLADENRDPKVIWYGPARRWVMALYLDGNRYALLGSRDLKVWTKLCDVPMPGTAECPDFFELPVQGSRDRYWVFWGANGNYRLGKFDGNTFTPVTEPIRSNFGNTRYAAQTYFGEPHGRRVQIGWMNGSVFPGAVWNQQMSVPCDLSLRSTPDGPRLASLPVRELESLHGARLRLSGDAAEALDFVGKWRIPTSGSMSLAIGDVKITFDAATGELGALGRSAKLDTSSGWLSLRVLVDRASIEIFAQDGLVSMPLYVPPIAGRSYALELKTDWPGKAEAWSMRSAWR